MKELKNPLQSSKICIIFFTDGRDSYTERMLKSFYENVKFSIPSHSLLIADNPEGQNIEFLDRIKAEYKIDEIVINDSKLGIFGSVQKAWGLIPEDCNLVWHQENDFLFNESVNTDAFIKLLDKKLIHQVALLRQAWYDNEVEKGGIFQANPRAYRRGNISGYPVVLHREYFTHNPCMYRKEAINISSDYNEYSMMNHLKTGYCAFWGGLNDAPRVTHIGEQKV